MKIFITGATGLVGRALTHHLKSAGHDVHPFARPTDWNPDAGFIDRERLEGCDAVIHLAGENIAAGRWTPARKTKILDSRRKGTQLLAETLGSLQHPPKTLISASAIGYYGDRGEEILDEQSNAGRGFLAEVCKEWESATTPASDRGIRVVRLRIGIVLSSEGGALPKMVTPFKLGAGGRLGSGRQYMSWITLNDLCRAVNHIVTNETLDGPVNAVSPTPVTNHAFTSALASTVCRPALIPALPFALRLALGELADALMLASTRVAPIKLLESGFRFQDVDLSLALRKNVGPVSRLHKTQWIARPPEEVFPFFADATNLDRITPPWLHFQILNPNVDMHRGTIINYKLRLRGVPLRWQSEIVEWEPPYRFVDVQRRGPYRLWIHEHRFQPHNGGTLVQDDIQYSAPGGALVRNLLIAPDLDSIFSYRKERLEQHFA
jgi:uncharacterized protein (TIGR01777 family)